MTKIPFEWMSPDALTYIQYLIVQWWRFTAIGSAVETNKQTKCFLWHVKAYLVSDWLSSFVTPYFSLNLKSSHVFQLNYRNTVFSSFYDHYILSIFPLKCWKIGGNCNILTLRII